MPMIQINQSVIYKLVTLCTGGITLKILNDELTKEFKVSADKDNESLLSVHLMARHGARTPMSLAHSLEQVSFLTFIKVEI